MPLEIRKIKVKDLYDFSCAARALPAYASLIPISRTRAQAYAHNPHASPDDIGLLVALIDDRCVGYLGIMPGLLVSNGIPSTVYWFCTFFIEERHRGKGYGMALITEAFSLGYDFAVSSMSASSERAFRAAGMRELGSLSYDTLDLRWLNIPSVILRALRNAMRCVRIESRPLTGAAHLFDRLLMPLITFCFYLLLSPLVIKQKRLLERLGFEPARGERPAPPEPAAGECSFYRDSRTVSWMIDFPWTLRSRNAALDDKNYFFTPWCESFDFTAFSSRPAGGALFSSCRRHGITTVKALDSNTRVDHAAALLLVHAAQRQASALECPQETGLALRQSGIPRFFFAVRHRQYLYYPASDTSPLERARESLRLHYCDGENPFA